MPHYNNKMDVMKAIMSVKQQIYKNWELIIIDDCSTDGSYEYIENYLDEYPDNKIILKRQDKNRGCYICMNEGILISNGELITRLDSDDKLHPEKLLLQVNYLNQNQNMVAVNCIYERSKVFKRKGEATLMFKKNIIEQIGYYDSVRFGADTEFRERLEKVFKNKVGMINKTLYFALNRKNSLTNSKKTGNGLIRDKYKNNYQKWHNSSKILYIEYPLLNRPFSVDSIMLS